jgi:N-acetylglucosaminyldiphosphoundecaprenol N-acetyl-beta-D-mannosaminyltransferase
MPNVGSADCTAHVGGLREVATEKELRPLMIAGLPVVPFESYAQAVGYVRECLSKDRKCFCVAINPEKAQRAARDPRLLAAIRKASITLCDGIGISLAARLLYGKAMTRITGCDFFFRLIDVAAEEGWRVFLLGATPESNKAARAKLQEAFPGLNICGHQDGYFDDPKSVIRRINQSKTDLLFVAMGTPRQELWIAEHREVIDAGFCMGVGGSFDVASGQARRAPAVFRKTGTEFLYRLVLQPSRWRRQIVLPLFALQVLKARLTASPRSAAKRDG